MSMHDVEDLIESSIRLLDKSKSGNLDIRSMIYSLYNFQYKWDTGLTLFRLPEILIKHKYLYLLEVEEYPEYKNYKDYFDGLNEFSEILEKPDQEWSEDNQAIGAYFDDSNEERFIYIEAGYKAWEKLATENILNERDAIAPKLIDIIELARMVVEEAKEQGDKDLIAMWYTMLHYYDLMFRDNIEKYIEDENLKKIRDIVIETEAFKVDLGWRGMALPSKELIDSDFAEMLNPDIDNTKYVEFSKWWYEPVIEMYKN